MKVWKNLNASARRFRLRVLPLWSALAMSACAPGARDVDAYGAISAEEAVAREGPAAAHPADPVPSPAARAADASAGVRAGAMRFVDGLPRPVDLSTLKHLEPLNPRAVAMRRACDLGERLTIAALGDVLLHTTLQRQAVAEKERERFRTLWSSVEGLFARADLTYANLEGPAAKGVLVGGERVKDPGHVFDDAVYTSYPRFNYHPTLTEDLKRSGVDVVSTANNHSLDRGPIGVDRTIEALDASGLSYFGTRVQAHAKEGVRADWHVITEAKGWRIAWVGCTFSTNGQADPRDQVLECYAEQSAVLALVEELAAREDIDAVIAAPHWGRESTQELQGRQVALGEALLEAGAVAVVAGHPHVVQEWTTHTTSDGREGFILYSLGNFVSYMDTVQERASILLYLGLTRPYDGGPVFVNGVRHVPLWMVHTKKRNHVVALEQLGEQPAQAWDHILARFGAYNLYREREPMTTTPQCDTSWEPPAE
ncbi:MAG: CapA family protein [Myxococcota bacterium]